MPTKLLPVFIFAVVFALLLPSAGFATNEVIGDSLCNAVGWMSGKTGKALVTIGMLVVAVAALLNKMTWGIAIIHIAGGALVMEASIMVSNISAGGMDCT